MTRPIKLPEWHCQGLGTVAVFWHVEGIASGIDGREVYGFTCTRPSRVNNWIGRCCESLAFTCISTVCSYQVQGP
jgi:hypothetical protein